MLKSVEQKRAKFAWEKINYIKTNYVNNHNKRKISSNQKKWTYNKDKITDHEFIENFLSYIKKTPVLILKNGLGNTLAFFKSKKKNKHAYYHIYSIINEWFIENKQKDSTDILEWILDSCTSTIEIYQFTEEIIAVLGWIIRFADSELKDLIQNKNNENT